MQFAAHFFLFLLPLPILSLTKRKQTSLPNVLPFPKKIQKKKKKKKKKKTHSKNKTLDSIVCIALCFLFFFLFWWGGFFLLFPYLFFGVPKQLEAGYTFSPPSPFSFQGDQAMRGLGSSYKTFFLLFFFFFLFPICTTSEAQNKLHPPLPLPALKIFFFSLCVVTYGVRFLFIFFCCR